MISHRVEICPGDLAVLRGKLDEMTAEGARIVTVVWQPQRVEQEQSTAYEAHGSFVVVADGGFDSPLRSREPGLAEETAEVAPLT